MYRMRQSARGFDFTRIAVRRPRRSPVLALHDGEGLLKNLFEASCRALDAGAAVLVLGCTGMLGVAAQRFLQ